MTEKQDSGQELSVKCSQYLLPTATARGKNAPTGEHWLIKGLAELDNPYVSFRVEEEAREFVKTYNAGLRADSLRGQITALNECIIKARKALETSP